VGGSRLASFEAPEARCSIPDGLSAQHERPEDNERPERDGDDDRNERYP
jgi:hypothetical protein